MTEGTGHAHNFMWSPFAVINGLFRTRICRTCFLMEVYHAEDAPPPDDTASDLALLSRDADYVYFLQQNALTNAPMKPFPKGSKPDGDLHGDAGRGDGENGPSGKGEAGGSLRRGPEGRGVAAEQEKGGKPARKTAQKMTRDETR